LNPKFLHKKYRDLRFSKNETDERLEYYTNRLAGLGHHRALGVSLPLIYKKYKTNLNGAF